jgi:ribosomal-protein-alanine N-acetyltransferase
MGLRQWADSLGQSRTGCADLRAGNLRLVAITHEMLCAEKAQDMARLGELLHAKMTGEWPPAEWEPHVYGFILKQYEEHPETMGWHRYVVLSDGLGMNRTLVGAVGAFPKSGGDVEIGYSTLPQFQRRGYATACAKTLVDWLLTRDEVTSVSACTFPRLPESIKVMERCGMTFVGDGDEPGTVRYQRVRKT